MMKKTLIYSLLFFSISARAQTNTFPADGNAGIGTTSPIEKLDIRGNIYLRNMANINGAGSSISFSSYDDVHLGPKIYSYLDYAAGVESQSRLILSSYGNGYHNELTLINGKVGIGTMTPSEMLSVNGVIRCREVKVEASSWPDYVFDKGYELLPLAEIEKYINKHKHLPNIPAAKEIETKGLNLGELNSILVKKIEELTLHLIEKDKQIQKQDNLLQLQTQKLDKLQNCVNGLLKIADRK